MTTIAFMAFMCTNLGVAFNYEVECAPLHHGTMYSNVEQCKASIESDPFVAGMREDFNSGRQTRNREFKCMSKPITSWKSVD